MPSCVVRNALRAGRLYLCLATHSEANALLFARASVKGATLYCTDEPCPGCRKLIRSAGIETVVWPEGFWNTSDKLPAW